MKDPTKNPTQNPTGNPSPIDVRRVRRRMRLTQAQFAGQFGFSVATLRHWERGNRRPTGTALMLLQVIALNPRAVLQAARKLRFQLGDAAPKWELPRTHRAPKGMATVFWAKD